jgi:hypothetical protein
MLASVDVDPVPARRSIEIRGRNRRRKEDEQSEFG